MVHIDHFSSDVGGYAPRGGRSAYPVELVEQRRLDDGTLLRLRPIRADDLAMHARFTQTLSSATHYARFLSSRKLGEAELKRMTDIDYASELALVATIEVAGMEDEIGVARYVAKPVTSPVAAPGASAGVAVVVTDRWQRRGVAEQLMRKLIAAAANRGVDRFEDITLHDNRAMLTLARKLGFTARRDPLDPYLIGLRLQLSH